MTRDQHLPTSTSDHDKTASDNLRNRTRTKKMLSGLKEQGRSVHECEKRKYYSATGAGTEGSFLF